MFLAEFNQAPPEQLKTLLKNCVHIPAWAEKITSGRPYSSKASLLEHAENLSQMWSWQDIETALATHPKIGERQAKTTQCKRATFFKSGTSWHFFR